MPKAFISYAHEDQEFVLALADRLREEDLNVEFDQVVLRIGDSLIAQIADAISDDDFLIAVVSPDSVESEWCRKEVAWALTHGLRERRVKVLPVRFRGVEMPPFLSDVFYADAEKFDIPSVAHALAAAIKSHRAGDSVEDAVAEAEQTAVQRPKQSGQRRDELVARLDGSVLDSVVAVLGEWGVERARRNAQRRLRFVLETLPDEVRDALPMVGIVSADLPPTAFSARSFGEIESDLRAEIRSVRSQLVQGLPLARRWMLVGPHSSQSAVPTLRRFGTVHTWPIVRDETSRSVSVYITDHVLEFTTGLARDVVDAKKTEGRTAVTSVLSADEPPELLTVATYGIRWGLPDEQSSN